jgi:hypothetical protein
MMDYFDVNFAKKPPRFQTWFNRLPITQGNDMLYVALAFVLIFGVWGYQRFELHTLDDNIAALKTQIDSDQLRVGTLEADNQALDTDLTLLDKFDQARYALSDIALTLATWKKTFPSKSTVSSIKYENGAISTVEGRADSDATVATTYSALKWKTDWEEKHDGSSFTYTFGTPATGTENGNRPIRPADAATNPLPAAGATQSAGGTQP